jgi:hypothetical protein
VCGYGCGKETITKKCHNVICSPSQSRTLSIYSTPPLFGSHEQKKNSSIILCVFVQYPQAKPKFPSFSLRDLQRLGVLWASWAQLYMYYWMET